MTKEFVRGFMDKLAEQGSLDLSFPFLTPWVNGRPEITRARTTAPAATQPAVRLGEDSGVELEQNIKPNWIQRNPWIFKPIVNLLNVRYGSGAPVTGFKFSF